FTDRSCVCAIEPCAPTQGHRPAGSRQRGHKLTLAMAPAWATRHNDWRVWVGVFCCLAALQYFIFFICSVSYDSWRTPNGQKSPQPTVAWPQPFPASEVARGKDRQPTSRPSCEPGEPCLDRQSQEEVFRRRFGVENPCNLTDQFTFSALSRASTLACRKELVSVACKAKMGTLFPTSLQTECRIESLNAGVQLLNPPRHLVCQTISVICHALVPPMNSVGDTLP
ncbi:unnamed protein product, partial [Cyprideis torosa]